MSDSYQATYDAVRSRISNGDIGNAVEQAIRNVDIGYYFQQALQQVQEAMSTYQLPSIMYQAKIDFEGGRWVCKHGGVCGFGTTPHEATCSFNDLWFKGYPTL